MKLVKRIIFSALCCCGLMFGLQARASYFYGATPTSDESSKPITRCETFNAIKCIDYSKKQYDFYQLEYYQTIDEALSSGSLWYSSVITDGVNEYCLKSIFYKENSILGNKVYLDEDLIFEINNPMGQEEVPVCKEINLLVYSNNKASEFTLEASSDYHLGENTDLDTNVFDSAANEKLFFGNVYAKNIQYNEKYCDEDVYFVVDVEHPLSIEELSSLIDATDETDGDLKESLSIHDSDYVLTDNKINVGKYYFDTAVCDSAGNTSYQRFFVKVVDTKAPVITGPSLIKQSYTKALTLEQIIQKFTITDIDEVMEVKITKNEYSSHTSTPGTYGLTIEATDKSSNVSSFDFVIEVIDDVCPVIIFDVEKILTPTPTLITESEIRSHITIDDAIDGTITNYTLIDEDYYYTYGNREGSFYFTVEVYDKAGNRASQEICVYTEDMDYPVISADAYVIGVEENQNLSKEDITRLLEKMLELDLSAAQIESLYFQCEEPKGSYPVYITLEDGTLLTHTIRVGE